MPPSPDQGDLFGVAPQPDPADGPAPAPGADRGAAQRPLAVRMRPRTLAEVVGQDHILRPGSLLPRLVAQNRFGSLIFYGPPGSGKTSIAEAIAQRDRAAVLSGSTRSCPTWPSCGMSWRSRGAVRRRRRSCSSTSSTASTRPSRTSCCPDVEEGNVRLIGATTHNPGLLRDRPAPVAQPPLPARAARAGGDRGHPRPGAGRPRARARGAGRRRPTRSS